MTKRRRKKAPAEGRGYAGGLPPGAVPADPAEQPPHNSMTPSPLAYVDQPSVCRDCGKHDVWTAADQKWYHEVVKGTLFARAVRCDECPARVRREKAVQREQMAAAEAKRAAAEPG